MLNYDDYFGGMTEKDYVKATVKHLEWLKEHCYADTIIGKTEIISANEATSLTREKIDRDAYDDLRTVMKNIRQAINNKVFTFTKRGDISNDTIRELYSLGYDVEVGTDVHNDPYYTVRWGLR